MARTIRFRSWSLVVLLAPACAWAGESVLTLQQSPLPTESEVASPVIPEPAAEYPTGTWGGLRPSLEEKGLTLGGSLLFDISQNFTGGISTANTPMRYLLDLHASVDMEKVFNIPGGELYFAFQSHHGPNASENTVGDIQGFDAIDGPEFIQIYELFYRQYLWDKHFSVKVGKIDANVDFALPEHSLEFLSNGSAPSTLMSIMPSYPDPAPGVELFFTPDEHFYIGVGTYYSNTNDTFLDISGKPESIQTSAGGMFVIEEMGYRYEVGPGKLPGHVAVGGWQQSGVTPTLADPAIGTSPAGIYGFIDQTFMKSGSREVGGYLNLEYADPDSQEMTYHVSSGLTAKGVVPSRNDDVLGAGISWVKLSPELDTADSYEISYELFYRLQLTKFFSIKPDLQYIQNPSGTYSDAFVATLRLQVDF